MDLIIGCFLLVVFCLLSGYHYLFGISVSELGFRQIIQLIISGGGGAYILSPYVFGALKKIKIPNFKFRKKEDMDNTSYNSDDDSMNDFKALLYLKERAIEIDCQEALDLVVKLNTLLFSHADHCKEEEKQNENKD
jgi:hypothetical protein